MNHELSRRRVLVAGAAALGAGAPTLMGMTQPEPVRPNVGPRPEAWESFPNLDPALIGELVLKSHFDEKRVRELVGQHPSLVNTCYDWGFGDWETPLGAASHMGQRAIAEFLIEKGARIDLFAAAMLGYTDVLKALIVARPGVQRLLGPHGIPLLAHARMGGEKAKDALDYLTSLGDAGVGLEVKAIEPDERKKYLGTYAFGPGSTERFEIKLDNKGALAFSRPGELSPKNIYWLGGHEFFPAGVFGTRFVFDPTAGTLVITAGSRVVRAKRV